MAEERPVLLYNGGRFEWPEIPAEYAYASTAPSGRWVYEYIERDSALRGAIVGAPADPEAFG